MPASPRILKRRIKSIRSTRKIMKAMELVAASKMRRAVQLALGTRPYAAQLQALANEARKQVDPTTHAYLAGRAGRGITPTTILVVAASDRGLCGGFNTQIQKKALEFLRARGVIDVRLVTIGRRADVVSKKAQTPLAASFETISNAPGFVRIPPMASFLLSEFEAGRADRVFVAFTEFKSALTQIPRVEQLLPVIPEAELEALHLEKESVKPVATGEPEQEEEADEAFDAEEEEEEQIKGIFEPNPGEFFSALMPRLFEIRLYQMLLESAASEHSARMMAMKNAGESAGDMLEGLTLTMNQARQAGITREISEISAGKAAIE